MWDTLIMLFHLIIHKNPWYESIIHDFHPDYQRAELFKQYSGLHNAAHNATFSFLSSSWQVCQIMKEEKFFIWYYLYLLLHNKQFTLKYHETTTILTVLQIL